MRDVHPRASTGLEHLTSHSRRGHPDGAAGVTIAVRGGLALASVIARKGAGAALQARAAEKLGMAPPDRPRITTAGNLSLVWSGPGQWLAVAEASEGAVLEQRLRDDLGSLASIADQSDGRIVLRLSGSAVRDTLAKGMPIDLHPASFAPGDAALTLFGYTSVHIWQVDAQPTYDLAVFRSYAADLWRHLVEAGTAYGVDVT